EMIRDNALLASGMLGKTIGGPSVKPYQPDGLWSVNGGQYTTGIRDHCRGVFRLRYKKRTTIYEPYCIC
ncbi:MAG: hypothetical protein R6Y91_08755, partial [Desulfohalobium sp.]